MTAYGALVGVHITAGALGLLSMVGALLARKGSRSHRQVGWAFAVAMAATSATGLSVALSWIAIPGLVRALASSVWTRKLRARKMVLDAA